MTPNEIRSTLERLCREAGGQREFAKRTGLSSSYVNKVINGLAQPGNGILEPLGLERIVIYRPIARKGKNK